MIRRPFPASRNPRPEVVSIATLSDPGGRLQIRSGPRGTEIASSRPLRAASVFVGRELAETARLLPALFSICATAQSAACAWALEQAQGMDPDPSVTSLRRRLVAAETLREHLWRVLLDWPRFLDGVPDAPAMARAMDAYGRLRAGLDPRGPGVSFSPSTSRPAPDAGPLAWSELGALVAERVLGVAATDWLDSVRGLDTLADWCERTETVAARLLRRVLAQDLADLGRSGIGALPELGLAELDSRLGGADADAFVARPVWGGEPRETSPLTRHRDAPLIRELMSRFGNGLLTRLAAQILELAQSAGGGRTAEGLAARPPVGPGFASPTAGVGLAQVPAARGLLVHRVRLSAGRVADYRILAPTEWNFHPQGVVAAGLDAIATRVSGTEFEPLARLFIAAVDPCVDYDLIRT